MIDKKAQERFWNFVHHEPNTGCWLWSGFDNGHHGYGKFRYKGRNLYAHRISYELEKGEIPENLVLDHLCRNTICVNPGHLEAVTFEENLRRGKRAKDMRERTHCPHGHQFSGDNLKIRKSGARRCLSCLRRDQKKHYQRKKDGLSNIS